MIFALIAGTYTPVCLIALKGNWGWSLLSINWSLAIVGIILKLIYRNPARWLTAVLFTFYILMGWLIVVAFFPLIRAVPKEVIFWLMVGGIFYTSGAIILNIKRLKIFPGFGCHELWHLFVMAGSFSHFWMMYRYIAYL